ncbi:hypothetical protein X801_02081 [Opisthorchis viverrini]|uniref:Mur ligase central domain-containing protein n=1 Tax=Opisthorchis viverrini TaxID=6198 RepID=A0A1S8X5V3_OPIVI|nr:hypothetical protein X801_02081 [Opisthorchis viverrini]
MLRYHSTPRSSCPRTPEAPDSHEGANIRKPSPALISLNPINVEADQNSPHLVNVEERIRIGGRPVSKEQFAQLFWDVHESVKQVASTEELKPPSYLQYIILMACKAFVEEKVDAAVVEVGLGGRYDHTNFFSNPCVTVVTSLSLEHTEVLGNTIEEIAGKKAGIFKHGCPAIVSDDQTDGAINVFLSEASKIGNRLKLLSKGYMFGPSGFA